MPTQLDNISKEYFRVHRYPFHSMTKSLPKTASQGIGKGFKRRRKGSDFQEKWVDSKKKRSKGNGKQLTLRRGTRN